MQQRKHKIVLIPVHQERRQHWILFAVFLKTRQILAMDSLFHHGSIDHEYELLVRRLEGQIKRTKGKWTLSVPNTPRQPNGNDCGLYAIACAGVVAERPAPALPVDKSYFNEQDRETIRTDVNGMRPRYWNEIIQASLPPAPIVQEFFKEVVQEVQATSQEITAKRPRIPKNRKQRNKRIRSQGE